ncbi:serine/arginine repetitive matrix protein 1-like [Mizuhopecten yessoensis]|uniref:Chitin-binding type-4 domain-containing protein n=1 Tax=Mizuhopecten yessoensis TaxID=6573 RepID=A0A210QIJ2_MIZYE|nr:serine/arginine repetitive matrix protein 1-like [Mizuhopecten yessoensis]OWF48608.1 hypothetical protein KP79_PYT01155 [Mizuhopecten yessoensis]
MLEYHVIALLLASYAGISVQHGFLSWPPQRSSLWRQGHESPINYNDNALWCGGLPYFTQVGEKCGTCGDAYYGPHDHEAGGKYGLGIIGVRYPMDTASIKVTLTINAYHKGFFEFKICPHNNPLSPVQQECLDQHPLKVREAKKDEKGLKYFPPKGGEIELNVELPKGIRCSQCVLQWKYKTGNSWGQDRDGNSCLGCGPQEQFQNCADISIGYDAPPEEKTFGFTKRSVTVHEEHTKRPAIDRGTIAPDQILQPKDANTNTLSPSERYVVYGQSVITSAPDLPPPPPKVPPKIDISAVTLTDQLQEIMSRQTLSLTNPPVPPLYIDQWTTQKPSSLQPTNIPPKQKEESLPLSNQPKKTEPSAVVDIQHHTTSPPGRRFAWKQVEVRTSKNLETHGKHRTGMVISKPLPPGTKPKPSFPTSVPNKIKNANLLLSALTDRKTTSRTHTRGSGVRRSRTKPKKLTRKQRRRAEQLAKKQRREAARLAKKAAKLARRRKSKTETRRSRRRRVMITRKEKKSEKSLPVPPQQTLPAMSVISARVASTHNQNTERKGSTQRAAIHQSTISTRVTMSKHDLSQKPTTVSVTSRKHSVPTEKQHQVQNLDTLTSNLSSRSSKGRHSSKRTSTVVSRTSSSTRLSQSRSSSKGSRNRYSRRRSNSRKKDRHQHKQKSDKNQHSRSVAKQGSQPEYSKSYLELVSSLKKVINQAEKVAVKPNVLKSMKEVLSAVSNGDPTLAGRRFKCFTNPSSCSRSGNRKLRSRGG